MVLDRKYDPDEVAEIAARGTVAMERGGVPQIVVLTAHIAAASANLDEALEVGPLPGPVGAAFYEAALALRTMRQLLLLLCATGPVSAGTKQ